MIDLKKLKNELIKGGYDKEKKESLKDYDKNKISNYGLCIILSVILFIIICGIFFVLMTGHA